MNKIYLICAAIILSVCANVRESFGQTLNGATAIIRYGDHTTAAITDFSAPIPIPTNEAIDITLHFRHDAVGQPVVIEAPDGGSISVGNNILIIGNNEQLTFDFIPANGSIQSSIRVRQSTATFSLTFSVGAVQD